MSALLEKNSTHPYRSRVDGRPEDHKGHGFARPQQTPSIKACLDEAKQFVRDNHGHTLKELAKV